MTVIDTCVLSSLAKIDRLDLLRKSFLCEEEEEKMNWSINTEESCRSFKMSLLAFVSNVEKNISRQK